MIITEKDLIARVIEIRDKNGQVLKGVVSFNTGTKLVKLRAACFIGGKYLRAQPLIGASKQTGKPKPVIISVYLKEYNAYIVETNKKII